MLASMRSGARITIRGIVQGVGFRPFVYGLAARCGVRGSVRNDSLGVQIVAFGEARALDEFVEAIRSEHPPAARLYEMRVEPVPYEAREAFVIEPSAVLDERFVPLSPDLATCADCLRELFDPNDRRCRYPFINCTNCGPRFTIIRDIPYDRPKTTMDVFPMCADCEREYHDPADRRFHAQPNACPACGPKVTLLDEDGGDVSADDPVRAAVDLLLAGKVVAVKGLGGYHLACDATSDAAVGALRSRKWREDKPFAVMMRSLDEIGRYCVVDETAKELLTSVRAPIVLLDKRGPIGEDSAGPGGPALQRGDERLAGKQGAAGRGRPALQRGGSVVAFPKAGWSPAPAVRRIPPDSGHPAVRPATQRPPPRRTPTRTRKGAYDEPRVALPFPGRRWHARCAREGQQGQANHLDSQEAEQWACSRESAG